MPATSPRALAADRTHLLRGVPGALSRGKTGSLVATLALALFAVIFGLVRSKRSAATDVAITMKFQRRRHPWLARSMEIASWPGFPPQSRLIPPALVAALWVVGLRLEAAFQLLAWGTSGISYVFKSIMRRPRPQQGEIQVAIARIGGTSFPSGHVLAYMGNYGFLAYLAYTLIQPDRLRRAVVGAIISLVSLVGPSRIYLGHHWATDVLASYLLGTSYLIGLTAVYRRVKSWVTGVPMSPRR
ncbi:MAG: phosphatase PAP2 family protein [Chloroflexia bacterium]|nr:phosphatase PAP2 family protein [Chloroflexia bacterium]MDQ3512607.1 phosphatase PAP2 family protein [Chloroflexota bacterium]